MWTGCEIEESGNRLVQPQKKASKQERVFGPHFSLILLLENAVFTFFSFSFFEDGCFRDSRAQKNDAPWACGNPGNERNFLFLLDLLPTSSMMLKIMGFRSGVFFFLVD
jgi:hypothetical protein